MNFTLILTSFLYFMLISLSLKCLSVNLPFMLGYLFFSDSEINCSLKHISKKYSLLLTLSDALRILQFWYFTPYWIHYWFMDSFTSPSCWLGFNISLFFVIFLPVEDLWFCFGLELSFLIVVSAMMFLLQWKPNYSLWYPFGCTHVDFMMGFLHIVLSLRLDRKLSKLT